MGDVGSSLTQPFSFQIPQGVKVWSLVFGSDTSGSTCSYGAFTISSIPNCTGACGGGGGEPVDPNRQLGKQVHLPILNFQGQDDVCRTWIEVQIVGRRVRQGRAGDVGRAGLLPAAVRGAAEGGVHGAA